jgi:hypothetical protein
VPLSGGGGTRVLEGVGEGLEERVPLVEVVLEEWGAPMGGGGIGLPGRWRRNSGPWRLGGKLEERVPLGEGVLEELGSLDDGGGTRVLGDCGRKGAIGGGGCSWT